MALDDSTAWDTSDDTTAQGQQTTLPGGIVSPAGSMDINGLLRQVMAQQPVQLPQMPTRSASDGTSPGWLGLLGEALAGGQSPLYKLRGAQEDTAGSRALLNFGIGMMLGSGPSIVKPSLFSAAAQGLQAAQQSMDTSQQAAYTQAGQQFEQQKALAGLGIAQQDARIKQLAAVLPLLRLQQGVGLPNTFGPGTTPPSGDGTYAGTIGQIEGGPGKNPRSSAQGYGQFTDATWSDFMQAHPEYFAGMTPQQAMAARSDPTVGPKLGAAATEWLAQRDAASMKNFGATPTPQALGIAHYVGAGPAAAIMNAPDNMPVSAFVSPDAVSANPEIAKGLTVGQLKQRYAGLPAPSFMAAGGRGTQFAGPGVPTGTAAAPPAVAPRPGDLVGPRPMPAMGPSTPYTTPAALANTPTPGPQLPPSPAPAPPAAPPPPSAAPPAQTAPPPPPTPAAPPPAASLEEYRAAHGQGTLDQPDPKDLASLQQNLAYAQQQAEFAKNTGGDMTKASQAVTAATKAIADLKTQARNQFLTSTETGFHNEQQLALDTQKATRRPAQPSELAAAGISPEPGVNYQIDPFGNISMQQVPVDPRLSELSKTDIARFDTEYAKPHDSLVKMLPVMDQMDALRQRMIQNGGVPTGHIGDYARQIQSALTATGFAPDSVNQNMSDSDAYQALASQMIMAMKQNAGLPRVTNYDIQLVSQQVPNLSQTMAGQEKLSGMLRQLWNYQDQVYQAANSSIHDRSTGYTLGGLDSAVSKLPPAIPQVPPDAAKMDATTAQQWRQAHGLRKGMVIRMPNGDYNVVGN